MSSDNTLEHYGVKGMKWGVRRRQDKAKNFAKKSKEARSAGKIRKADRLHSKSRSYVQGSPEYAKRLKRNLRLTAAGILAVNSMPMFLEAASATATPENFAKVNRLLQKVEKTRLRVRLRNDIRFDPSNADTSRMITKGLDFIKKSRGVYNITSL